MDLKFVISVNSTTVLHITASLSGFMLFCFSMKYDKCVFHILIRVLSFQLYYTFRVSLRQPETCLLQQLNILLYVMRLRFELRASYCSTSDWNMLIAASYSAACYAFSFGSTHFIHHYDACLLQLHELLLIVWFQLELRASYCSTSDWNMLIAASYSDACYAFSFGTTRFIHHYDACLLQLHELLLITWLHLELRASYCSTSGWNILSASCSWTRACYVSSIWATRVILCFGLEHTKFKFEGGFLAPAKKGRACHRGD
jgi:hypothetical protein